MKRIIAGLCIAFAWCTTGFSESPTEQELYARLTKGPDQVKALESVLEAPDGYSALTLYMGARLAFKEKRLADSGFLFYAAQLRTRFDEKCFPAKKTGGNSPYVLYAALSQDIGSAINPAVMAEPKTFANVIGRLKKWSPKAPPEYTPGYEFTEKLSEKDALEATKANRTEFISRLSDLSTLLDNSDYCAGFRVVQTYNLADDDKRPSKEEYEKAVATMKKIEKDTGLKGVFSNLDGSDFRGRDR